MDVHVPKIASPGVRSNGKYVRVSYQGGGCDSQVYSVDTLQRSASQRVCGGSK